MENKLVPKIRFSEFTNDWEQRKLGEISNKIVEKNKNNLFSETLTNSAEYGIITQRDFFDKDISNEINLDGYYVVHENDFVYNPRISNFAPVGPIKRNKLSRTGIMSPLYYVFRTHSINKSYLEYFFDSTGWHSFMKLNGDSGARADRFAIKDSVFREMPIPFPNLDEQIKIGKFFEKLSNLITLHQRKLDMLKKMKRAYLQQMFPKSGESVPRLRFAGFEGEWEQRKLGDVTNIYDGTHQTPDYKNKGIMFLSVENIKTLQSEKYISEEAFINEFKVHPENGDVLMTRIGDIGTANVIESDEPIAYYVSLALLKKRKLNPYFLQSSIHSPSMKNEIWKRTLHIAFPKKINKNEIANLPIRVPNKEEQAKIGIFFKQLEDNITLNQTKLDKLTLLKKTYLQKMFM
ncbi:restriction endonuclease subunit S [Sedimentibacter sp.]|uniref:restriction endonuclease subunit S n=1 Tax=Sedimentibacter sp. TaxID=1960295 RepID=UPI00289A9363|nr:restriction endonuclease subunit S [Sedimentibacter sp.]